MRPLLAQLARRFAREDRGVAAVEMAFIAPVALAFLAIAVAGGQAMSIYHKTVLTAHIVTDMVSRTPYASASGVTAAEQLPDSDLDSDLALSQLVFYPEDPTNLKIVMTELKINPVTNQGTVVWSEGYNGGTALTCSVVFTLDPSYALSGATYLLYGQASYTYQPLGITLNLPSMTFNSTEILTIRDAPQIIVPGVQTQC